MPSNPPFPGPMRCYARINIIFHSTFFPFATSSFPNLAAPYSANHPIPSPNHSFHAGHPIAVPIASIIAQFCNLFQPFFVFLLSIHSTTFARVCWLCSFCCHHLFHRLRHQQWLVVLVSIFDIVLPR